MKQIKLIIAVLVFSFLSVAQATAGKSTDSVSSLPVELKFKGLFESQYLFELHFSGTGQSADFHISITDESGYEFYDNKVKGPGFTKQFSVNEDVLAQSIITFTITENKTGKKVSYRVNRQQKISHQMHIVKL